MSGVESVDKVLEAIEEVGDVTEAVVFGAELVAVVVVLVVVVVVVVEVVVAAGWLFGVVEDG